MNRHVYELYSEAVQKNQFVCTTEEVAGYMAFNFKHHPADMNCMITTLWDTDIKPPKDIEEGASRTEIKIW